MGNGIIRIRALKEESIYRKLLLTYVLVSLIPLVIICLFYVNGLGIPEMAGFMQKAQPIMFFVVLASVTGFFVTRNSMLNLLKILKEAKRIANGDLSRDLKTDELNEIGELSESFNKITSRLRKNIDELKESKKLLQNVLTKIGSAMSSSQNIDSLLELIVQTMSNGLSAKSGAIMLLDESKKELHMKVAYGLDEQLVEKARFKIGEGVYGWVAQEGKPLNIEDVTSDDKFGGERSYYAERSMLAVPLIHRNKVIGTISCHDKVDGAGFTTDDLILLSNLATQTAVAIINSRLSDNIENTYIETITALAMAVEAKDPYTRGHTRRVSEYVDKLSDYFKLNPESKKLLSDAATLHDIGKIGVSDRILSKAGALTPDEYELIQQHVIAGENIVKPIKRLSKLCDLIRHHQEWVNGEGYPDGIKGDKMSLELKILCVVDAFDAMTSDRPYRKALDIAMAKEELKKYSGTHFDKEVVDAFVRLV